LRPLWRRAGTCGSHIGVNRKRFPFHVAAV
jgi:hypothetical protein